MNRRARATAVLLGLLCLVQAVAMLGGHASLPYEIAVRLRAWGASGDLWYHASYTIGAAGLGFVLGGALAVLLALALHRNAFLRAVVAPLFAALYGTPKTALAPLFVVWFGIGAAPKVLLASSIVFFVIFDVTTSALRSIDQSLVDTARVVGASDRWIAREVLLPALAPYLLTAFRLAIPQAIGGAVAGELISSNRGLGYVLQAAATDFDSVGVFAGVFTLAAGILGLSFVLEVAERRILAWRPAVPGRRTMDSSL